MKKIQIGNFKTKVQILRKTKTKDALGSATENTQVLKTCWAQQIEVAGSEEEEGKIRTLFDAAFIIKYDRALHKGKAVGMILKDEDNDEFEIASIIEIEFRKYLRINAVKSE